MPNIPDLCAPCGKFKSNVDGANGAGVAGFVIDNVGNVRCDIILPITSASLISWFCVMFKAADGVGAPAVVNTTSRVFTTAPVETPVANAPEYVPLAVDGPVVAPLAKFAKAAAT